MRALLAVALVGCGVAGIRSAASVDRVAYPNGNARFEFELRNGLPNGHGTAWHPNGKLASEGTYVDGGRHGRFRFYNEDGTFLAQAFYFHNAEVWRSTGEREEPPAEWAKGLDDAASQPQAPTETTRVVEEESTAVPRPYFFTLDRTTQFARAGAQLGVGSAKDLEFGAATRLDVFGNYTIGRYGVFAQLSETRLAVPGNMTLGGRRTALLAGSYHLTLGRAILSTTGGFIVPLGNVDPSGSVASYAGAEQRPADAALAIPAPFGVRSAASLTEARGRLIVQADAGIDWPLGGDEHGVDALGRANVGVCFGNETTMLTAEIDNALHLSGTHAHLHTVAVGATIALPDAWLGVSLVLSYAGTTSVLGSVGHDL